jgi:hypothetical protein
MDEFNEMLEDWLLSSGIVINDSENENFGGVHAYYDSQNHEYGFLYPEITGYFLSMLRFLHERNPNEKYTSLAKTSGNWIIKISEKYGGIIQGISKDKTKLDLVYSFDTAICAKGLLDCFMITKEEKFFNQGKKLCDWIIDEALESDGTVKPVKNLKNQKFEEDDMYWYKQKGCLHIKTIMPLLQIYQMTKEEKFLNAAELIINTAPLFQNDDGSITLHQKNQTIHLHSLCYTIEGLLFAYGVTKDENLLQICDNAIEWCCQKILDDGSILLWYNSNFQQAKTSYHISQLMRIMLLIDKIQSSNKYSKYIEKLFKFLKTFQAEDNDSRINGGLYEEYYKSLTGWKKRNRINSWGSMFALQGIIWFNERDSLESNWIDFLY